MAGRIEDLFTQFLWDFDRIKSLNCSPMKKRFQDFAHGSPLCCYYNIKMLHTQHTNTLLRESRTSELRAELRADLPTIRSEDLRACRRCYH
jgi:hypothetical protein